MDFSECLSFALRQQIATSVRSEGTPNALLSNLLILVSIASPIVVASIFNFLAERLREFFRLNFILQNAIKNSKRSSILHYFEQIMVVSSMNAFKGGMLQPPPRFTRPALSSSAFKMVLILWYSS